MSAQHDRTNQDGEPRSSATDAKQVTRGRRRWLRPLGIASAILIVVGIGLVIAQGVIQSRAAEDSKHLKGPEIVIDDRASGGGGKAPVTPTTVDRRHPIEPALDKANEILEFQLLFRRSAFQYRRISGSS